MTTPNLPPLPDPIGYAHPNITMYGVGDWFAITRDPKTSGDVKMWTEAQLNQYALAAYQAGRDAGLVDRQAPDILFDGYAVLQHLSDEAKTRTGPDNVADVLDAVVNALSDAKGGV